MRVVGGKTGADGRLFAYLVWTVPGGPAEKGGLQQGDKVFDTSINDFRIMCWKEDSMAIQLKRQKMVWGGGKR